MITVRSVLYLWIRSCSGVWTCALRELAVESPHPLTSVQIATGSKSLHLNLRSWNFGRAKEPCLQMGKSREVMKFSTRISTILSLWARDWHRKKTAMEMAVSQDPNMLGNGGISITMELLTPGEDQRWSPRHSSWLEDTFFPLRSRFWVPGFSEAVQGCAFAQGIEKYGHTLLIKTASNRSPRFSPYL